MPQAKINSSSLENIKRQFDQECLMVYEGYVYKTDLSSQEYVRSGIPIDKDGYPTPVSTTKMPDLLSKMEKAHIEARAAFIRRASAMERMRMTQEVETQDEHAE
jgi:hypothetical protein